MFFLLLSGSDKHFYYEIHLQEMRFLVYRQYMHY